MGAIKQNVAKVTNNLPGAIVGGVAVFYAAKKFGKVENKWGLAVAAIVGAVAGAMVQSKFFTKGAPTAETVNAPVKK